MHEDGMDVGSSGSVKQPAEQSTATLDTLWTRRELAGYLRVSSRWLDSALARARDDRGSIPHVVLPSSGSRRQIRFVPEDIHAWVAMGCPPADEFYRACEGQD